MFSSGPIFTKNESKLLSIPTAELPEPEKVRHLFDRLANRYDCFNRCASLGLDRIWRKVLISTVSKIGLKKKAVLDLGTGTGSLLFDLLNAEEKSSDSCFLIGIDFSEVMLKQARSKLLPVKGNIENIRFIRADMVSIPLVSESIDVVLSAFAMRNVKKNISKVLSETWRVMKPGGNVFFLEMYVPDGFLMRTLHKVYLKTILTWIGWAIFRKDWSGNYLAETIFCFGSPSQFSDLLRKAGFQDVQMCYLSGGIAVLHTAKK